MNTQIPLNLLGQHYLERLDAIKDELLLFLNSDFSTKQEVSQSEIERQHILGRSRFFINTVIPWINSYTPLKELDIVEIGPGTGSMTAPLGFVANSVSSYDISETSANVARFRCEKLGLKNVTINTDEPENLLQRLKKDRSSTKTSLVILFATLEHMTIAERIDTIKTCWDILEDGGLILVGDTPNRLTYLHGHTSRYPFFDMVPDELMLHYAEKSPNDGFAKASRIWKESNLSINDISERIDRWGRGISFHEFEVAIGETVSDKIVGSGLNPRLVKSMPLAKEEILLMRFLNTYCRDISLSFARGALYFILKKGPKSVEPWEETFTRQILDAS